MPKKIIYLKTVSELEKIATYTKIDEEICRYTITVQHFEGTDQGEYTRNSNFDIPYYYIALRHLFQNKYKTAIVSFLSKHDDVCIQITLLPSITVENHSNVSEWKDSYTYCRALAQQNTVRFIANLNTNNDIDDYIIGFATTGKAPILLTITADNEGLNIYTYFSKIYFVFYIVLFLFFTLQYAI